MNRHLICSLGRKLKKTLDLSPASVTLALTRGGSYVNNLSKSESFKDLESSYPPPASGFFVSPVHRPVTGFGGKGLRLMLDRLLVRSGCKDSPTHLRQWFIPFRKEE